MTKPKEFRKQQVVHKDTHYEVQEGFPKGPFAGAGVLTIGRVVWVREQNGDHNGYADAFADGIGVVSIDWRSLSEAS